MHNTTDGREVVRVAEVARVKRGVHPSVMEPGDTLLVQHWYVKLSNYGYFDNHVYMFIMRGSSSERRFISSFAKMLTYSVCSDVCLPPITY